jgi:hypothetical protein
VTFESGSRLAALGNIGESVIVDLAERALRAARIQVERIWAPIPAGKDKLSVYGDILIDVHFYFISLRNTYRFLNTAVEQPVATVLRVELDALNTKWFRHYSSGREAFEHIDQRLPGQRHEARIVELEEGDAKRRVHYGLRMRDGQFAHSDQEWDITVDRFAEIESDVRDLLDKYVRLCEVASLA